jgi:hypothetical protein
MTDDLDQRIRQAFEAVELSSERQAELLAVPGRTGWSRGLLVALVLLSLGLAATPVVQGRAPTLLAGLLGWPAPARTVDFELSSLDASVPAGLVHVIDETERDVTFDLGVQELLRGDRTQLLLRDREAWGAGPVGTVRLAQLEGPLRLIWAETELDQAKPGSLFLSSSGDTSQVVARVEDRVLLRGEPSFLFSHGDGESKELIRSDILFVPPVWPVPGTTTMLDGTTGQPLGPVAVVGSTTEGMTTSYTVLGHVAFDGRRPVLAGDVGDGRLRMWLPVIGGAQTGDEVAVQSKAGAVLLRTTVEQLGPGVGLLPIPELMAPLVVRDGVEAHLATASAVRRVGIRVVDRDFSVRLESNIELVAIDAGVAIPLGRATLDAGQVTNGILTYDTELALPAGVRPRRFRIVVPTESGVRVSLVVNEEVAAGRAQIRHGGVELAAVDVIWCRSGVAWVEMERSSLHPVLLADDGTLELRPIPQR